MIWPIAILVGLIVFGSIYWLKPSPRDKRLAGLRLDAIKRNLQVRQFNFKPDAKGMGVRDDIFGTSYTLVNSEKKQPSELLFSVVRQAGWEMDGLPEGLAWNKRGSQADADQVAGIIDKLNDELWMLEVYGNRVIMMVAENKTATAENYEHCLRSLLPA
ncbi:MAG: hypothetical protein P1U57_09300 [Oleibacter sp.]|nr:hypothetical protein [Thalassolituus sp.]